MRKRFYERYREADPKLRQAVAVLPWGHNLLIINKTHGPAEAQFYATYAFLSSGFEGIGSHRTQNRRIQARIRWQDERLFDAFGQDGEARRRKSTDWYYSMCRQKPFGCRDSLTRHPQTDWRSRVPIAFTQRTVGEIDNE